MGYGAETQTINAFDCWYLGNPYEELDDFLRMSPMPHIRQTRTPDLIVHVEIDRIDPLAHSRQFYRGLGLSTHLGHGEAVGQNLEDEGQLGGAHPHISHSSLSCFPAYS